MVDGLIEALDLGAAGLRVRFEPPAIRVFEDNRQTRFYHREAGGQLFGHLGDDRWIVARATGPDRADRRWRFGFMPDRMREQREIHDHHARGYDYLGDWHTHPEDVPSPSPRDLSSIDEIVRTSTHHLPGFLLCIVGRCAFPCGLWVSFHPRDGQTIRLRSKSHRARTGSPRVDTPVDRSL